MTLQEAISHAREKAKELREQAGFETDNLRYMMSDSERQDCRECATEHEQLADWLEELKARREADRWVPVSERLPNTLGVYNVTRKLNEGETIYYISGASYFDGQNTWYADTGINHGRPYLTDIIAWKPLPKPYESEGEE